VNRFLKSQEIEALQLSGELTKKEAKKLDAELWDTPPKGSVLAKLIGITFSELIYACKELCLAWLEFNKEEKEKGNESNIIPFTLSDAFAYIRELFYRGTNWLLWMQLAVSSLCLIRELQGKSIPSFLEALNWIGHPLLALALIGLLRITLGVSVLFQRTNKKS
jgi:hypothetical protein